MSTTTAIEIDLKSENDDDLSCVDGMYNGAEEPVRVEFGEPGSETATVVIWGSAPRVIERVIDKLENDDNVLSYEIREYDVHWGYWSEKEQP